jgi:hypothetical protein
VHAGGAGHGLVDDVVDAPRRRDRRQVEAFGQPLQGRARCVQIDLHLTAREIVGVQVPEQEVGIGDGGLAPALPVRSRARVGARAPRSHLEQADLVHVGDTSAPSPDLDQLDGGDTNRKAAAFDEPLLTRCLEAIRRQWLPRVDEAQLGGRTAHVEGEQVGAVGLPEERGGEGARGRSRL